MKCPSCKSVMVTLELNDVEIDHCFRCGGIWLDAGELESLLHNHDKSIELIKSIETKSRMKCPICGRKMDKVLWKEGTAISLDKCCYNDGIWFDNGELMMILESDSDSDSRVVSILKDVFRMHQLS